MKTAGVVLVLVLLARPETYGADRDLLDISFPTIVTSIHLPKLGCEPSSPLNRAGNQMRSQRREQLV
jgi:hypothetical protein